MANNRLFLIDRESKKMICIAKQFGEWNVGNVDLLNDFLNNHFNKLNINEEMNLELIDENHKEFFEITDGFENENKTCKWEYCECK